MKFSRCSDALAKEADVTIASSGDIKTMNIAAERLKVTIAGSGTLVCQAAAPA